MTFLSDNGTVFDVSAQAIIYDLDGTLVDTLADIGEAMNDVLRKNGFPPIPIEEYTTRVGWGASVLVQKSVPSGVELNRRDIAVLADQFREAYAEHPVVHSGSYPGIREILEMVGRNPETRQAVLSNKPDSLVKPVVDRIFGGEYFDFVRGALPDQPIKPDPTSTIEVLGTLGVSPNNALFIGDSEVDMKTARHAGCVAIGVTWGFRNAETVQGGGAEYMMDTTTELRDFISEWLD